MRSLNYFTALRLARGWSLYSFYCWLLENNFWKFGLKVLETNSAREERERKKRIGKYTLVKKHQAILSNFNLEKIPFGTSEITTSEYYKRLGFEDYSKEFSRQKQKAAYEAIVDYRKFEIELYWKRAAYFWAFMVSIFAILGVLVSSSNADEYFIFLILCVGFLISNAWYYSNKGSKFWQRHWEKHLDLIEDSFTGSLYKTVFGRKSYSVSKINLIVSNIFRAVFLGLFIRFILSENSIGFVPDLSRFNFLYTLTIFLTFLFWSSMKFGQGRGRFRKRDVTIYRRET